MNEGNTADTKIVRLKLSDQVFERLRDMLVSGELAAGDTVPSERALMKQFGVGRPAVREALQMMQNKGLINITHGGRSRVNTLTAGLAFSQLDDIAKLLLSSEPDNIHYLKQVRHILELGTVRIAAEKCTAKDAKELAELVEVQRSHLGNAEAFIKADIDFHLRLAKITTNPLIVSITEMMLIWLFEYHSSLLLWSGREETTLSEHTNIIKFLQLNDNEGSTEAMEMHLNRSDSRFKQVKKSRD